MATHWYGEGLLACFDGRIDADTTTLRLMLVKSTYVSDKDQALIDDGSANDLLSHELVATNYAGGHGGAGRKTVVVTLQRNAAADRIELAFADTTWANLGGAANDTIGGVALVKPGTADDTTGIPVAFFDVTDTPTNGGSITIDFATLAAGGNAQVTY